MEFINVLPLDSTFFTINAIIDSTGIIDNEKFLQYFMKNISLKRPSRIIIEKYNIEGEPSFLIIKYNGNSIEFIYDSTKTQSNSVETYLGNSIDIDYDSDTITYNLYSDNTLVTKMFSYTKKKKRRK